MSDLSNDKIDLSDFLIKPEDLTHLDIKDQIVKDAIERVSEINEKTCEQFIIKKQQDYIKALEAKNKDLEEENELLRSNLDDEEKEKEKLQTRVDELEGCNFTQERFIRNLKDINKTLLLTNIDKVNIEGFWKGKELWWRFSLGNLSHEISKSDLMIWIRNKSGLDHYKCCQDGVLRKYHSDLYIKYLLNPTSSR